MKLNFKIFSKSSSVVPRLSKDGTGYSINPVRDWTMGLFVATLCFLVGVTYIGFDFYSQISRVPNEEIVTDVKPVTYKEKDVVRYAEFYAEKASTFNKLREQRPYIPPVVVVEEKKDVDSEENIAPLAPEPEGQYTDPVPSLAQ